MSAKRAANAVNMFGRDVRPGELQGAANAPDCLHRQPQVVPDAMAFLSLSDSLTLLRRETALEQHRCDETRTALLIDPVDAATMRALSSLIALIHAAAERDPECRARWMPSGGVRGGRLVGVRLGPSPAQLNEGRDLHASTDLLASL